MKDKVYIASPFFNENQIKHVKSLEQSFEDTAVNFFSPRTFVLDLSHDNPEREANAKKLFDKDLVEIHTCNLMDAYIDETFDMGTLFEVGYFYGLSFNDAIHTLDNLSFSGVNAHRVDEFIHEVDQFCRPELDLNNYDWSCTNPFSLNPIVIYEEGISEFLLKFTNIDRCPISRLRIALLKLSDNSIPVFLLDDKPWKLSVVMGIFRALGIPFLTASCQNYGSNIMIASASLGHIMLPAYVNPYKLNIEIK